MRNQIKILKFLFALNCLIYFYAIYQNFSMNTIIYLKCTPIIILIALSYCFAFTFRKLPSSIYYILFINTISLIFCGIGDYFMEMRHFYQGEEQKKVFILGILGFLIAQLIYSYLFSLNTSKLGKTSKFTLSTPLRFSNWIPFILFIIPVLIYLKKGPNVDNIIFIGVVFYAICISIMAWRAVARKNIHNDRKTTLTTFLILEEMEYYSTSRIFGSIIFIISDLTIALTTFRNDVFYVIPPYLKTLFIMVTYWTALYLFTASIYEYSLTLRTSKTEKKDI